MDYPSTDDEDSDIPVRQLSSEDDSSSDSDCYDNDEERPQQLVKLTKSSDYKESLQLEVDDAVLENVIKSCGDRPVSVINIIGDCRSGKSMLMNHLVQKLKRPDDATPQWLTRLKNVTGFPYNSAYEPVTQGIWVWNQALLVQSDDDEDDEIAVIVMDTQGFPDEQCTTEEILLLAGISVVSSSLLIVNLMGEFPEAALEWLSPIGRCGQHCVENGVKAPFQRISYLIRDWSMLQQYAPWGDKGGSKLLKNILETPSGEKFLRLFEDVDCTLLPHIGEKALKKTHCKNADAFCPEFSMRYAKYINQQVDPDYLTVRKVMGNNLDPDSFKTFFLANVKMLNESVSCGGLSPQAYWETTLKAAEKIKTERGLTEYRNAIKQLTQNTGEGVLRDSDISSLHISAKKKCLKAFRKFQVPKSEEARMEKNIQDILDKETQKSDRNTWERQVQQKLEEGQLYLRAEAEESYPFLFSDNPDLIFYDTTELEKFFEDLVDSWVTNAVEEMECENKEAEESIKQEYVKALHKCGRRYKKQNADVQEAAEEKMTSVVSQLTKEYSLALDDMMEIQPNIDKGTLQTFQSKEMKTMERKFREVAVGTPEYRERWAVTLKDGVEKEWNMRKANLKSTMALALDMVRETEKKYRTELEEIVMTNKMNVDDIQRYHDQQVASLLKVFKRNNPFPKQSSKRSEMKEKLKSSLNTVFINVLGERKDRMERLENVHSQAVTTVLEETKIKMEAEIDDIGFWEQTKFEEWSLPWKKRAQERMTEIVANMEDRDRDPTVLLQKRAELTVKMDVYLEQEGDKNLQRVTEAEQLASQTLAECLSKLEMRMINAVKNCDRREQLLEEHERVTLDILEDFRRKSGIKTASFLKRYLQEARNKAEKLFEEIDDFFTMKKTGENAVLIGVIADVKQVYMEEMKQLCKSKRDRFSHEELEALNEKAKGVAIKAVTADKNLTPSQTEVVMDHLAKYFETFRLKNALTIQSFQENDVAIGIDLGTTYCCVAVYLHGKVQVLRNDVGANTTPSYVCITSNGDFVFGQNAKKMAYKFPESTIFDTKRILGRNWNDKDLERDREYWPFTVKEVDGVPQIEVHGKYYKPEEISSMLLRHLKQGAEKVLNVKISKAVITVPAYFSNGQRQATYNAGKLAGLDVLGILNEPSAAALDYRFDWFHDTEPRKVLVYDLGGGTFDVAVLKMGEKSIDVLGVRGDSHLGGEDFDQTMMKYCADVFNKETGINILSDKNSGKESLRKRRLRRLQTQCEEGKKQIMTAPSASINVDAFVGEHDLDVDMSREEFDALNSERFQRTIQIVDTTLKEANVKKEEIDDVILVGGSTRIPKIQKMLQEYLGGKALNQRINPDEAVACGAALQAVMLNCPKDGVPPLDFGEIQEITPMSLGVELSNNLFDIIIPRNTKFPVERKEVYGTRQDKQTNAEIKIYQGEHSKAVENELLGKLCPPAGQESIEVAMTMDHNGILKVVATDLCTGLFYGLIVQGKRGGT